MPSVGIYLLAISTIERKSTYISINNKAKSTMQTSCQLNLLQAQFWIQFHTFGSTFAVKQIFIILILEGFFLFHFFALLCLNYLFRGWQMVLPH